MYTQDGSEMHSWPAQNPIFRQGGKHMPLNIQAKAAQLRDKGQKAQPAILLPNLPREELAFPEAPHPPALRIL